VPDVGRSRRIDGPRFAAERPVHRVAPRSGPHLVARTRLA